MRRRLSRAQERDGRRYRYDIGTDDASASPFRRTFEWALGRPLDLAVLPRRGTLLLGEHDFRAFAAKGEPKPHYRCRLSRRRVGSAAATAQG